MAKIWRRNKFSRNWRRGSPSGWRSKIGQEAAEKWVGRLIPLASSAIGGALNFSFVRGWGRRVQRNLRARHLAARCNEFASTAFGFRAGVYLNSRHSTPLSPPNLDGAPPQWKFRASPRKVEASRSSSGTASPEECHGGISYACEKDCRLRNNRFEFGAGICAAPSARRFAPAARGARPVANHQTTNPFPRSIPASPQARCRKP